MTDQPYPYAGANETWQEFADAQLDHEPTQAQQMIKEKLAER